MRIASCLLLLLIVSPCVAAASDIPRPNLLIIQTDEHNFRTLGCYRKLMSKEQALMWGPSVVETPNIDSLAERGAICESFYATTPVCSPSRGCFVSGRYPQNTPVVSNNVPLADDIVTFAELLKRAGYATGFAGKWHLDGDGKPQWAPERKFGFDDNRYMFNRGHWKQLEDTDEGPRVKARDRRGRPSYAVEGADQQSFSTDFLTDRTIEFIEQHRDEPFCYYLSLPDPHGPDRVRAPYDTQFAQQSYAEPRTFGRKPEQLPGWAAWNKQASWDRAGFGQAQYHGMVKCIDDNVGKLLATLERVGIAKHTIVVFTSDHGDLRGEHHRQNKGVPYEASAKIPFLLAYDGHVQPRTVIREALGCVDFLPTILALMNVEPGDAAEGRDASALFREGKAPGDWKDVAFIRSTGGANKGWVGAVSDRYKLVCSPNDPIWLFDLEQDPDELINFAGQPECEQVARTLASELLEYGRLTGDPKVAHPGVQSALDQLLGEADKR